MQALLFPHLERETPLGRAISWASLAVCGQAVSEQGEKQKTLEAKASQRREPQAELVCRGRRRSRGKEGGRETQGRVGAQRNSHHLS